MGRIVKQWVPAGIATIVCLLALFTGLRDTLIEWAVIVAAFAFLLGLLNIGRVHFRKAARIDQGGIHSVFFLLAAGISFVLVVIGPDKGPAQAIFNYVISPVGASLAALMLFTLTLAAFRMLGVRRDWQAAVFILVTVVALVTSIPLLGLDWGPISQLRAFVVDVAGMAGMRGLLLGVVMGTVVTAIRALWPRSES